MTMPYVPVPKDLARVKTKLAFNLTKRQLVCFSLGGLAGLPVYFLTRGGIGKFSGGTPDDRGNDAVFLFRHV